VMVTVTVTAATALLGACAANEDAELAPPSNTAYEVPTQDAAVDGPAKPCPDCEYFPTVCTDDVLCPFAPMDPSNPASPLDPRAAVLNIRGRGPNDVWLTGAVGTAAHFDGVSWTMSNLGAGETQRALWLLDSSEISFGAWKTFFARGADADESGDAGLSPDGWSIRPFPAAPSNWNLSLVYPKTGWAAPRSDVFWVGADGGSSACGLWRVTRRSPSTVALAESMPRATCNLLGINEVLGIHGASSDVLWAVGGRGTAARIDGANETTPTYRTFNSLTTNALRGVWAASDTDVWAVGTAGTIRHYRGDSVFWEVVEDVPTNEALNGVWGTSASDIWAVGNAGVVLHYDGARWSRVKVAGVGEAPSDLYTVWSPAPGQVWIGGQGVVLSLGGKP